MAATQVDTLECKPEGCAAPAVPLESGGAGVQSQTGCLSSAEWCEHFRRNRAALLAIRWETTRDLTAAERDTISRSVQIFQRGESGEGRHFLKCASRYAARTRDAHYVDAVRLLIAEEQRHAADLGHFLDLAGIGRIRQNWSNGVFRRLRKLAGLETIVAVLVVAEIIAKVYYRALFHATNCPALKRLCAQILRDELAHVRFQCERLELLRCRNPRWLALLKGCAHAVLFRTTCCVVWCSHKPVLLAGGFDFRRFRSQAAVEFQKAVQSTKHAGQSAARHPHPTHGTSTP